MQNLIQFLIRNGVFFLFLGLEIICLYLVVHSNDRQGAIYQQTATAFVDRLNQYVEGLSDYSQLRAVADSVLSENARLRTSSYNQLSGAHSSWQRRDSVSQFGVVESRVIKNSITSRHNFITLDKGRSDGIRVGMGVVGPRGPVGVVVGATQHFTKVMSVLHSDCMLSVAIQTSGYFGSLVWRGANPRRMRLEAIPKHAEVAEGDTVVTSGYSLVFPPGIVVGRIERVNLERGSNFYTLDVLLNEDLSNIDYVYVVENVQRSEQDSLQIPAVE